MANLADVLKAIKELITVTEKVRENTEEIKELKKEIINLRKDMEKGFSDSKDEFRAFREESRLSDSEFRGDIKAILNRLDTKEEVAALKVQLAEHIAACEKARA